jgi:MraZ protein
MAGRFFGRYEHSLDVKGRITLPARFRLTFGSQLYVSQYLDGCLALWTAEQFDAVLEERQRAEQNGREDRNLSRVWAAGSAELDVDGQGRIPIPQYLREYARLEGMVLVNGAVNRVELWNPAEWELRVRPSEIRMIEGGSERPTGEA